MAEWVIYLFAGCIVILAWALVRMNDRINRMQDKLEAHYRISHPKPAARVIGSPSTDN